MRIGSIDLSSIRGSLYIVSLFFLVKHFEIQLHLMEICKTYGCIFFKLKKNQYQSTSFRVWIIFICNNYNVICSGLNLLYNDGLY